MLQSQVITAEQIRYRKPIAIVQKWLEEMNIKPETDIRVYPVYPVGWFATVGAHDRIWIFTWYRGLIGLEIQPIQGFLANGGLIIKPLERRELWIQR